MTRREVDTLEAMRTVLNIVVEGNDGVNYDYSL